MKNYVVIEEMRFWDESGDQITEFNSTIVAVCSDWCSVREAVNKAIRNLRLFASEANVVMESFDRISYVTSESKRQVDINFKVEEFNEMDTLL